ncbi:dicarboxylate symporter family protein, partial [Vibrio parahaemolyticus V-223/04]
WLLQLSRQRVSAR